MRVYNNIDVFHKNNKYAKRYRAVRDFSTLFLQRPLGLKRLT